MPDSPVWAAIWTALEATILVAALLAARSARARYVGRLASGALFIVGGALFNAVNLATGGDYGDFADSSYIPFVHHTWRSVVDPHQWIFIPLLVLFEAAVGVLVLAGGRRMQLGYAAAIAFHVALMSFGWVFYPSGIAMILAFGLLLRAERKHVPGTISAEKPAEHRQAA